MAFNTDKLSYLHSFSKMPVQSGTNFTDGTTLGNAINKSGHTVTASEVWASDIPYFGKMGSLDDVKSKVQPYASKNDMCFITTTKKTYIYDGDDTWTEITLKDGDIIKNAKDEAVLLYHKGINLTNLTASNNANTDSANNAARLWVTRDKEGKALPEGVTRLVEQFVGPTDKAINGLASVAYSPVLADGSLVAGTNYYDYCFSGTILWASARTAATKIDCFEYIGPKVSTVVDTVSAQGTAIQNVKDQVDTISDALGLGSEVVGTTLGSRVTDNETALKVLLGLAEGDKIAATESIATTAANAVSTSLAGSTAGTIGKAIADAKQEALDAINAIQHFSVVVVPVGQTMENVTPVENTIYLVSDAQAADGSYIEYIAFKQGEAVVTEKIGSTKLDPSGYTTVAEHQALQTRVNTAEGQIATITSTDATKVGSIAKALADAKTYVDTTALTPSTGSIAKYVENYVATNAKVSVNGQSATTITVAGTAAGAADLVKVVVTEDKSTTDKIGLTLTATLDAAVLNEDGSIDKDGVVIATIAQDIAESVADTAIKEAIETDSGAIKDAIDSAISDATLADGQKIATTTDTSKLVTVEDVTTYVSENAKVTLTQGTGITVTPNG
jgi:hypothetical protein